MMTETATFTTDVVKDIGNPNRFRWNIYENEKVRDKSLYSFATKREAQSDADKFVPEAKFDLAKLNDKKLTKRSYACQSSLATGDRLNENDEPGQRQPTGAPTTSGSGLSGAYGFARSLY